MTSSDYPVDGGPVEKRVARWAQSTGANHHNHNKEQKGEMIVMATNILAGTMHWRRILTATIAGTAVGIAVGLGAPATAQALPGGPPPTGCISGHGGGFGAHRTCDGPIDGAGWFTRCTYTSVLGFGGSNCYRVDSNNMGGQHINYWIPG